jgi:hypothetical protein
MLGTVTQTWNSVAAILMNLLFSFFDGADYWILDIMHAALYHQDISPVQPILKVEQDQDYGENHTV